MHRQSFVIGDNMQKNLAELTETSPWGLGVSQELYEEGTALHELVHLAGIPDIIYFIYGCDPNGVMNIKVSAPLSTLQTVQNGKIKGKFFEEGLAALCDHMYFWSKNSGVVSDTHTELRHSPVGDVVLLPARHTYSVNSCAYAAWAMERLVGCLPELWNVFIASRSPNVEPNKMRRVVKQEIDHLDTRLFAVLDAADPYDLSESIAASYITDMVAKRVDSGERLFSAT